MESFPSLAVSCRGSDLLTTAGTVLLAGMPAQATTSSTEDGLACIIGASSSAGPASSFDCALGQMVACRRFLALSRTSIWWQTPAWGSTPAELPCGEIQFLLCELKDNSFSLLLPIIDGVFRATLRRPRPGTEEIILRLESGDASMTTAGCTSALLVAASREPFELMERGVTMAARLSGTAKHRTAKQVPPSVDLFGWCTWDAFYSKVNAAGIQQGLRALVDGGAPPGVLILDDGWQQTDMDVEFRTSDNGATSCAAGGFGMGDHLEAAKQVEQALHAVPETQATNGVEAHKPCDEAPSTSQEQGPSFFSVARAWLRAAYDTLLHYTRQLEAAFLLRCNALLEGAPSDSWLMRLMSTLVAGPLKSTLQRFYAHASDHTRRLLSVRANSKFSHPDAGPEFALNSSGEDLKGVVAHLKREYGVRHVICWHAMMGFWGGVSPSAPEMAKYQPRLISPVPSPGLLEVDPAISWVQPVVSGVCLPSDPRVLHNDLHAYLADCGVDGVKVDVQSTVGLVGSRTGGGAALSAEYHASLEESVRRHFGGNMLINCMCHSIEDLYSFSSSAIARVSDDFWPLLSASHVAHIANCSYNTLFMGELVIPDFDMFHSKHEAALLHATARAISGGPVYVSDRPGHHDFGLLSRLVLPDGSVLRACLPGRPTPCCLFTDVSRDGKTALKVWNMNPAGGVVGVFNLQGASYSRALRRFHTHDPSPPALETVVSPADIPALRGTASLFACYIDSSKELELLGPEAGLKLTVAGGGGSDVATICPVREAGGVQVAPIGLICMLNAGGAVRSCALAVTEPEAEEAEEEGSLAVEPVPEVVCIIGVKGCGAFLCYASQKPMALLVEGLELPFGYDGTKGALTFEVPAGVSMEQQVQLRF